MTSICLLTTAILFVFFALWTDYYTVVDLLGYYVCISNQLHGDNPEVDKPSGDNERQIEINYNFII